MSDLTEDKEADILPEDTLVVPTYLLWPEYNKGKEKGGMYLKRWSEMVRDMARYTFKLCMPITLHHQKESTLKHLYKTALNNTRNKKPACLVSLDMSLVVW